MARRILVVDDIEMNREILKAELGTVYDIIEAENGKEALELIHKNCKLLSAIILDIAMPVMDGYQCLKCIRESPVISQIPVIVVTASDDEESRSKALAYGANDFITKPYNPDIIKHCLRNNISLRETASIINAIQRDKLTGIYNREVFFEKAQLMIRNHESGYFILSCFDIDNFKYINDRCGAAEGDRILKHIGKKLSSFCENEEAICGRISGDNFAIVYPNKSNIISRVSKESHKSLKPGNTSITYHISVGRYVINDYSIPMSKLYDRAYIAKKTVKGKYDKHIAYFDDNMLMNLEKEQQIISDMDLAIAERQFETWLQPQYNHSTGALIGAEALVRWRHPEKGLIPPADFIPVFEQNGFVYELDKYVWEQTCRFIRAMIDGGKKFLPISVNISRFDVYKSDLIDILEGLIETYCIPKELLRLEITESAFSISENHIVTVINDLINRGFTVEIDDFGSGYSSLNTLKEVQAQILKLDMRFLKNTDGSNRGGNIIESIVRMAKWLGMSVIAEGVEKKEQADYLKTIGCYYIQGYYYAKPMPMNEYIEVAKKSFSDPELNRIETVKRYDNSVFWNPESMDTLIFNNYVGGSCIAEYVEGKFEILRLNDRFIEEFGEFADFDDPIIDLNPDKILNKDNYNIFIESINDAIKTDGECECEIRLHKNGDKDVSVYLNCSSRIIASTGKRYLVYCMIHNISEIRMAQDIINKSRISEHNAKKELTSIMKNIDVGVTAMTVEDNKAFFVFSNRKFYDLIGYTKSEYNKLVNGRPSVVFEDDAEVLMSALINCSKTRKPREVDYRIIRKDGSIRRLKNHITVMNYPNISKPVLLSVVIDITDRINKRNSLELMEKTFPGGVGMLSLGNTDVKWVLFNKKIFEFSGYNEEEYREITKNDAFALVYTQDKDHVLKAIRRLKNEPKKTQKCQFRCYTKSGALCWFGLSASIVERRGENLLVNIFQFDISEEKKTLQKLRQKCDEYMHATEHSTIAICRFNTEERILTLTERFAEKHGLPNEVTDVPYGPVRLGNVYKDSVDVYTRFYEDIINGKSNGTAKYMYMLDGNWRWIEASFSSVYSDLGEPISAIVSYNDITEQSDMITIYNKWEQSYKSRPPMSYTLFCCNLNKTIAFDSKKGHLISDDFIVDGVKTFDDCTRSYAEKHVYPEDRQDYIQSLERKKLLADYENKNCLQEIEYREILANGDLLWIKRTVELAVHPASLDVMAYITYENIDKAKREELQTIKLSQIDPLTGILNRKAFTEKADLIFSESGIGSCAFLMFDIDNFKIVNDVFGHSSGDDVLIDVVKKVNSVIGSKCIFGRIGGDEFAVVIKNISDDYEVIKTAEEIRKHARGALSAEIKISVSIGISVFPRDGSSFDELYKNSDAALYHAKGCGKDNYIFYRSDLDDEQLKIVCQNGNISENNSGLKKRMLIVENNASDYEMLKSIFSNEFIIDRAMDGKSALIRLRHYGYGISIVLIDLEVSGMGGLEILSEMSKSSHTDMLPVIVISGDTNYETNLETIRRGACDFIMKPIDSELLKIRILSAISKAENTRLKIQNEQLTIQSGEVERYQTVLKGTGISVIELDWINGTFIYDKGISSKIAGIYDNRKLWKIFLSDMVADTKTVQGMQKLLSDMAEDRECKERSAMLMLKTPSRIKHWFCMTVYKKENEFGLTERFYMAFRDCGDKLSSDENELFKL